MSALKNNTWDKHVAGLCARIVSAGAILPIPDGPAPSPRKSLIHAQKGITLRVTEASALVEAVMDGKVHRDYVVVGGQQCECRQMNAPPLVTQVEADPVTTSSVVCADIITTVTESAYYGRCTASSVPSGIVLVKTRLAIVLATYSEPISAAEAIPHVHAFADELDRVMEG